MIRMAVHGDETKEFLKPGQGLIGLFDQAQVQAEAMIATSFSIRRRAVVIDQDDRIVPDQLRTRLMRA